MFVPHRYLLGKHRVALETYTEASSLNPNDWVRPSMCVMAVTESLFRLLMCAF